MFQFFNTFCLHNFKLLQLVSVVLGLFDPFIYGHKLLIVLHLLKTCGWLDFGRLNSSVQLLVKHLHLFFMLVLQLLNLL